MPEFDKPIFPRPWPDACPPEDAADAHGTVYRLVKDNPPALRSFLTNIEKNTARCAPDCLRAGLSVMRTVQDAHHQAALFPHIGQYIAEAKLSREHGMVKLTSGCAPTHTTWWIYQRVNRAALFQCIEEVT